MPAPRATTAVCTTIALSLLAAFPSRAEPLPGSEWAPGELSGAPVPPETDVFIRFDAEGLYFGNGGCNTFRGRYVTQSDAILLGPAAATMMACAEPVARRESDFMQALSTARFFTRDGASLTLSDADGTPVLTMDQRDRD